METNLYLCVIYLNSFVLSIVILHFPLNQVWWTYEWSIARIVILWN